MPEKLLDTPFGNVNIDIEKVIDIESAKTFNFKAEVFNLDTQYHGTSQISFDKTAINVVSPLLVKNEEEVIIGAASLDIQGNKIVADVYLDYFTVERFDLTVDAGNVKLWPHLIGNYSVSDKDGLKVADLFNIDCLYLLPYPPWDSRVNNIHV